MHAPTIYGNIVPEQTQLLTLLHTHTHTLQYGCTFLSGYSVSVLCKNHLLM